MNIVYAHTFLEVVRSGTLKGASDRLRVTQSTVTSRLNTLEHRFGQRLLIRNKSGVVLTNAGSRFKTYAKNIVQMWGQAEQALSLPQACSEGLCIGFENGTWMHLLDDWIVWFKENQPHIALEVKSGAPSDLEEWVSNGVVDLAVTTSSLVGSIYQVNLIHTDRLILVSRQKKEYQPGDPTYILIDWGEEFLRKHAQVYPTTAGVRTRFENGFFALQLLMKRGGCAYLPVRMISDLVERSELHIVEDAPEFEIPIFLTQPASPSQLPWFPAAVKGLTEIIRRVPDRLSLEA